MLVRDHILTEFVDIQHHIRLRKLAKFRRFNLPLFWIDSSSHTSFWGHDPSLSAGKPEREIFTEFGLIGEVLKAVTQFQLCITISHCHLQSGSTRTQLLPKDFSILRLPEIIHFEVSFVCNFVTN